VIDVFIGADLTSDVQTCRIAEAETRQYIFAVDLPTSVLLHQKYTGIYAVFGLSTIQIT